MEPVPASGGGADDAPPAHRAVGTGTFEELPAQLVLKSIGYRSLPVAGLPFDTRSGTVPNSVGQVLHTSAAGDASPVPGLFVCGWLKRGPTGVIGTNLVDAEETVATVRESLPSLPTPRGQQAGHAGLATLLQARGVRAVTFDDWLRLDAEERARGEAAGKEREKVVDVAEMMRIVHPEP